MQEKINEELSANPALLGEEANDADLYSTLFPKGKNSARHGLGMVVGGKGSEQLAKALVALNESRKENNELRKMYENMEERLTQALIRFEASQGIPKPSETDEKSNQQTPSTEIEGDEAKVYFKFILDAFGNS